MQQDNPMWAEEVLGDHALCFVGPLVWLAGLTYRNECLETRAGWGRRGWLRDCRRHEAIEVADFYSTFFSKHSPIPACSNQRTLTGSSSSLSIYLLIRKSHLLATFSPGSSQTRLFSKPWYSMGQKRTSLPQGKAYPCLLYPSFQTNKPAIFI